MSGNSNSEGAFGDALRQFKHVLDTTPVVGQLCRSWEIPELERLIARYPAEARAILAELDKATEPRAAGPGET